MRDGMRRRGVRAALGLVALAAIMAGEARAHDLTTLALANPSTLGTIPGVTGGTCTLRSVTFDVAVVDVVQAVDVDITVSYSWLGSYGAWLSSPTGKVFDLFTPIPGAYYNPVIGRYVFSDAGTGSWLAAAPSNVSSPVPTGRYRTLNGTTITSLNAAFAGEPGRGRWVLTLQNCYSPSSGQITAAQLFVGGTTGLASLADPFTMGPIPDGPSAAAQTPGPPRDVRFTQPPGRGAVTRVAVSLTLVHTWVGDLVVRLIAPTGESHVIFGYTGATSGTAKGSRADLGALYVFRDDPGASSWWTTVLAAGTGSIPAGTYRTSESGGPGATGADTAMDPVFAGVPSEGVWTLRVTDGTAGDVGSVVRALLTLETSPTPTAAADAYTTSYLRPLVVAEPGVLANDAFNGLTSISAERVTDPTHGSLVFRHSGGFTYSPDPGFAGTDRFQYRATGLLGPGPIATVTITVLTPTTLQAPFGLHASTIAGQEVTLRWNAAPGPAPSDFVLEGGIVPGQPLATIGIGGPLPVLAFTAPRGIFFVRVRAVAAGVTSPPSNEIRIVVDVPEVPSAPGHLAGVVSGDVLGLSWRNTFSGGAPRDLELLVSGAATAALPLPLVESLSIGGVPAGTYSFRLRARNASGTGAVSDPVTLTFPGACSGPPLVPQNLLVFAVGNVVHAYWDPPASGPATTNYVLHVTGAFTGSVPMASRQLHAPAPPGSYAIAVAAQNACGVSAATPAQTAFVR